MSKLMSLDPEQSVMAWAWATYDGLTERYATATEDPKWRHLKFVRLRSNAEARSRLGSISLPV